MATATIADLSSVDITVDHLACTAVPSLSQDGIPFIIAAAGPACTPIDESRWRKPRAMMAVLHSPSAVCPSPRLCLSVLLGASAGSLVGMAMIGVVRGCLGAAQQRALPTSCGVWCV